MEVPSQLPSEGAAPLQSAAASAEFNGPEQQLLRMEALPEAVLLVRSAQRTHFLEQLWSMDQQVVPVVGKPVDLVQVGAQTTTAVAVVV